MAAGGEVPVPLLSLAGLVRRVALAAVTTLTLPLPASSRVVVAGAPPPLQSRPGPHRHHHRPCAGDPPAVVFHSEDTDERPSNSGY